MSTPLAQQTTRKPASSSPGKPNPFATSFFSSLSSNSNANSSQSVLPATNAALSATPFSFAIPNQSSIRPQVATSLAIQVASAQTLFQDPRPPHPPLAPKSLSIAQNDVVARATSNEGVSTGAPAQKTLGPMPHPDFTFDDGNITLQAGHMTFTVHRYPLVQHSAAFRDMFSLGLESTTEGTKENPVVLHHIDAIQFERLLRVLYPRRFDELPFKTAPEWHSVLQVADMFDFRECGIRKLAIEQLEKTASCVQKIVLGGKYGIKSLLIQGFRGVCNRDDSLTAHELNLLIAQPQTLEMIIRKREALSYDSGRGGRGPKIRAQASDGELEVYFEFELKNSQ